MAKLSNTLSRVFIAIINAPLRTTGVLALVVAWYSLVTNVGGMAQMMCGVSLLRPTCSSLHIGGVPTPEEESDWTDAIKVDTCAAYANYVRKHDHGEYSLRAQSRLNAVTPVVRWEQADQAYPVDVQPTKLPSASIEQAKETARLAEATVIGDTFCMAFKSDPKVYRFEGVVVDAKDWNCIQNGGGAVCGFTGIATCRVLKLVQAEPSCSAKR